MPKLSEIIDDATGETDPVSSLLRRLKTLASELGSASLVDWVDMELSGYPDDEGPLPPYRGPFKVEVIAKWAGPGGSHATMPLPATTLPEPMRKAPYELVFRHQSVNELQQLAQSAGVLMHAWPASAVADVNARISHGQIRPPIPGGTLVHAYRQFSPALIARILGDIRTRILDAAISLQQVAPTAREAPPVDPAQRRPVADNPEQDPDSGNPDDEPTLVRDADKSVTWDVHIGYHPPQRWDEWDELPDAEYARRNVGGHSERPEITSENIAWASLNMTPRWLDDDTSSAVAAIQPSNYFNRGGTEWDRFIAGTRARGQLALAISMIGSPNEPADRWPGSPWANVSMAVHAQYILTDVQVGGPRIALAKAPTIAEGLEPIDHDIALRLIEVRDPQLPWWSLELHGEVVPYPVRDRTVDAIGTLSPLLISAVGEVVAAVWTSPDGAVRHYVIPWMPVWTPVLEWLSQRAIPQLVLSAAPQNLPKVNEAAATLRAPGPRRPRPAADSVPPPNANKTIAQAPTRRAPAPRRPGRRLGTDVRALPRAGWNSVKKHTGTTIAGTIAAIVGGVVVLVIWSHVHPDSSSHQPAAPSAANPPIHIDPPAPPSTTATASTAPPPLPPGPAEEHEIPAGNTGGFFHGAVTIGIGGAYRSWSDVTITTAKLSCTNTSLNVGQARQIAGKNADRDDYFRITLLKSTDGVSATLRVEEMPAADWPTISDSCPG